MYARAVDDARLRLRELRKEEWSDLALGAVAVVAALAATRLVPPLALPLFVGGLFLAVRGVMAAWRRWDIVDELASEPDAYVIDEIRAYARRDSTMKRRQLYAGLIRYALADQRDTRLATVLTELESLAAELEDDALTLDPACAVACARLVSDPYRSPLLDASASADELRSQVQHVRRGFARSDGV